MKKEVKSKNMKCPSCGGQLVFDIVTQGLFCDHCQNHIPFEIIPFKQKEPFEGIEKKFETWNDSTVLLQCENCGSKEVVDSKNISGVCPFCGSSKIAKTEKVEAGLMPGAILPFSIDKKQIATRFTKWIRKKIFAPSKLKKLAKITDFQPVYTPCWSFDTDVSTIYNGILIDLQTRTSVGANGHVRTYVVEVPRSVSGKREDKFEDIVIQVGQKINQYNFAKILPYNLSELKVYSDNYLLGFMANHYSINCEESWKSAINIIRTNITEQIRIHHRADKVRTMNLDCVYKDTKYAYILLPVWIGNYNYKEKEFNFYINGNTGKVGGRAPVSAIKVILFILFGVLPVLFAIGYGIYQLAINQGFDDFMRIMNVLLAGG